MYLFTSALGRKPEEVVTSDLVAGGFPTDMGEGGVNLALPLIATIEYFYTKSQAHQNATYLSINLVINCRNEGVRT